MKSHKRLIIGIIAGLVGMCLLACFTVTGLVLAAPAIYQAILDSSSLQVGSLAPDFTLETLSGEQVSLSDFRGRPVLLTLGATWCPDCRREAPLLQQLHERQPDLVVLMIDSKEDRELVQAYVDEFGLTFPVVLDTDGAVATLYRVFAIPTELFIDADGVIQARIIESVTEESLARLLQKVGIEP